MLRQYELVERVRAYDPTVNEALLNRAYVYAMQKHGAQQRASGDPYFSHPIEVAGILTEMRLDSDSIVTALLHDVLEDTDATPEELKKLFGDNILRLVQGVTKLTKLELKSDKTKQAENFRKLVLAMSEDIRVLLVKLADRVHNMRTLHFIPKPEKRRRIAEETMEIYAPLAERLGMHDIRDELQELAFAELEPVGHESIVKRLAFLRESGGDLVHSIISQLQADLTATDIHAVIEGREKRPYSIWKKMQRKNTTLEQLSDIIAFRVMVDSIGQCYAALGVIHSRYAVVPGRFKDYISIPKGNGYQSLHTTIIGPGNHKIEIQIRTREMHEVAELGVAAHWVYKQGEGSTDGRQYRWLRELLDLLEQTHDPQEFLEHTK
ncbi:MAG: RelA/SpoT family protein, partial [Holosporales bacterium]